jgi:hypothetical protein
MTKDKKMQFNRIWEKGGKAKETLLQKVSVRGLEPTKNICFEYYMGWRKILIKLEVIDDRFIF